MAKAIPAAVAMALLARATCQEVSCPGGATSCPAAGRDHALLQVMPATPTRAVEDIGKAASPEDEQLGAERDHSHDHRHQHGHDHGHDQGRHEDYPRRGPGVGYQPGYGYQPSPGYGYQPSPGYGYHPSPAPGYGYHPSPAPGYGYHPSPAPGYQPGYGYQPSPGYGYQPGYNPGYQQPPSGQVPVYSPYPGVVVTVPVGGQQSSGTPPHQQPHQQPSQHPHQPPHQQPQQPTSPPQQQQPQCPTCLCVFDIDRTLTGKQGDTTTCPRNHQLSLHDEGYGGGPATLSALADAGIHTTFCDQCLLGITSAGYGSGEHSDWNEYLLDTVMRGQAHDAFTRRHPEWKVWSVKTEVRSPYVLGQENRLKQESVELIRRWYNDRGACVVPREVYFFGDRTENIQPFREKGFNSREISCGSRDPDLHDGDGMVGYCGARPEEIQRVRGNILCAH